MNGSRLSRRQWCTALAVMMTPQNVTAAPGFHVIGRLTFTDAEQARGGGFQLGKDIIIALRPGTEPHRLATEMLNRTVQLSLFVP